MKFAAILALPLSISSLAEAKVSLTRDLPKTDFSLLQSQPPVKNPKFAIETGQGSLRLTSNVSTLWQRGLYFDTNEQSLSIPGLGAAKLNSTSSGYDWSVSQKEASFEKKGLLQITKAANGCTMSWDFQVRIKGQPEIKESGAFAYSCSSGKLGSSPPPAENKSLAKSDLFPRYQAAGPSLSNQIAAILSPQSEDLNLCISRNLNRPSTPKEEISYGSSPSGTVIYRISFSENKFSVVPFRTPGDARMDSCVIDTVKRAHLNSISADQKAQKYLAFDIKCSSNPDYSSERYSCKVRHDIFDNVDTAAKAAENSAAR